MRIKLLILFLLFACTGYGQPFNQPFIAQGTPLSIVWNKGDYQVDSFFRMLSLKNLNGDAYMITTDTGGKFMLRPVPSSGSPFDSTYLYGTILPSKQDKSDTSTYDASKYWVQQQGYLTSFSEIDPLSLHISDTGTAFANYLANINLRLKIADTANHWLPIGYPLPTDYTPRLFLGTGSGVGTTYIDVDTALASDYWLRWKDTITTVVTPRQLHDSLVANVPSTPTLQTVATVGNAYTGAIQATRFDINNGGSIHRHVSNATTTRIATDPDATGTYLYEDNVAPVSNKALDMSTNTMTGVATGSSTDSFLVLKNNVVKKIAAVTGGSGDMLLGTAQTNTAAKTFNNNTFKIAGSTSGAVTYNTSAVAGTGTVIMPTTGTVAITTIINSLNASNLSSGVVSDTRLSGNVLVLNKQTLTTNNNSTTTSYLGFGGITTAFEVCYTAISQSNSNNSIHGKVHVYIKPSGEGSSVDLVPLISTGSGISLGSISYNDYSGTFTVISAGGVDVNWYLDIIAYKN